MMQQTLLASVALLGSSLAAPIVVDPPGPVGPIVGGPIVHPVPGPIHPEPLVKVGRDVVDASASTGDVSVDGSISARQVGASASTGDVSVDGSISARQVEADASADLPDVTVDKRHLVKPAVWEHVPGPGNDVLISPAVHDKRDVDASVSVDADGEILPRGVVHVPGPHNDIIEVGVPQADVNAQTKRQVDASVASSDVSVDGGISARGVIHVPGPHNNIVEPGVPQYEIDTEAQAKRDVDASLSEGDISGSATVQPRAVISHGVWQHVPGPDNDVLIKAPVVAPGVPQSEVGRPQ